MIPAATSGRISAMAQVDQQPGFETCRASAPDGYLLLRPGGIYDFDIILILF